MSPPPQIVEITSDFICPWCLIGARRLQDAIRHFETTSIGVRWIPFRLNRFMPEEGLERRVYRIAKFGSWERSLALDAQVAKVARADGISIAYEQMSRTPNTTPCHRLMRLAERQANPTGLANRLFDGYFLQGVDLSDPKSLTELAAGAGLDRSAVKDILASDLYTDEYLQLEREADAAGIDGVPTFRIGEMMLTGAQPLSVLVSAIRLALHSPGSGAAKGQEKI